MSDDSREESPDWLRCFEAPKKPILTLSSDSEPSPSDSPTREGDVHKEVSPFHDQFHFSKKDQNQETVLIDSGDEPPVTKALKSKSPKKRVKVETDKKSKSPKKEAKVETDKKSKSPKKEVKVETDDHEEGDGVEGETGKKGILEKQVEPHLQFSSRMPLVISEKVQRTKALVECEGDSMDMSGDVGSVGRIIISDTPSTSGNPEMLFDLKGTIYKTTIVPSRTFCVVSFGQAEAKIEAVMNDFIQLTPQDNVYEAETMIEGTLDGFSFDSDEEAEKVSKSNARQSDQNNEAEELTNRKRKGKADKASGVSRKKGKTAAKPPKKTKRKTPAPKKAKNAKK